MTPTDYVDLHECFRELAKAQQRARALEAQVATLQEQLADCQDELANCAPTLPPSDLDWRPMDEKPPSFGTYHTQVKLAPNSAPILCLSFYNDYWWNCFGIHERIAWAPL